MQINIEDANINFFRLVDSAANGDEIIITKAGIPIARLMPMETSKVKRVFGSMKGKIRIADDFDDPFPPKS